MKERVIHIHEITPEELESRFLKGVKNIIVDYLKSIEKTESPIWLTRKETAKFLGVSMVTIHNWSNVKHILKPYKIGTQIRFKKDEVEEVLINSRKG